MKFRSRGIFRILMYDDADVAAPIQSGLLKPE